MKPILATALVLVVLSGPAGRVPSFLRRDAPGVYLSKFRIPGYPPLARQARIQGQVKVTLQLRADGTVESLSNVTGPALLSDHVVEALGSWEFEVPSHQPTVLTIEFRYVLQGPEDKRNLIHQVSGSLPANFEILTNPYPSTWPNTSK